MAKLKSGTRIYGTATVDTNVVVGSAVTINASGINASGIITASTFSGQINAGVGTVTTLNATNTTLTNINSSGISTLGVTSTTNLTAQQLNVSGVSTFAGITTYTTSLFGTQASFSGVVTATTFNGFINAGVSTLGVATATNLTAQQLNVSGVSTLTQISAGGTVGTAGSILSSTGTGLAWIPAASGGGGGSTTRTTSRSVATAAQTSFSVTYTVGYIDVYLNGAKLDSTEYTASNGTTVVLTESASANDVLEFITFSNISLSSGTTIIDDTTTNANRYLTYTDATSGGISTLRVASTGLTFNPGTNTFTTGNIVGTALNISGVGTVSNLNVTGVSTLGTVSNLNVTGVSTLGTVSNLNVTGVSTLGISIPSQIRLQNVAEKLTRINGNTVSIVYNSGAGNIGLCTNPTGDITLAVTGIPTDSSFDNHSILFSVIVNQTGTARSCTAVTLNGVSKTIKWFGGSLSAAISGVTTTSGYDIYNFTGINTIGSASTTTNYEVLGVVNGGFR